MKRAISIHEIYTKRRKVLPFDGIWEAHIGKPELKGSWIIWGNSGNGKTGYAIQLAKYLSKFGRVAYNGLEEGNSESFAEACKRNNMDKCRGRFVLIEDSIEELDHRLNLHKSPDIIFIDSLQYSGINYTSYKELIKKYSNKLFIWISHAEGRNPEGRIAKKVRYDAFVKIYVEGYTANAVSRYGGKESYIIWQEGVDQYNLTIR